MFSYTITDPRNGNVINKTFKSAKGAVLFGWGYNRETGQHDNPAASFFKDVATAQAAILDRVNTDCIVEAL